MAETIRCSAGEAQSTDDGFYRAFEDMFRGAPDVIKSRLCVYLDFLTPFKSIYERPAVVDIGCGRGEWLGLLSEHGFDAYGVDLDEGMLSACDENGFHTTKDDGIAFLEALPNESQVVVSAFHVAEHLRFTQLQALVRQAFRVLKPGGLLIIETPNLENLIVSTLTFYYDPTHRTPLPFELLSFTTRYYGFDRIKKISLHECCKMLSPGWTPLDHVLRGASWDLAVIAQKAADMSVSRLFDSAFEKAFGLDAHVLVERFDQQLVSQNQRVVLFESRIDEECAKREALKANLEQEYATRAALKAHLEEEYATRAALKAHLEEECARRNALAAELMTRNEALAAVYASPSWRITAPLRDAQRAVHRLTGTAWMRNTPKLSRRIKSGAAALIEAATRLCRARMSR